MKPLHFGSKISLELSEIPVAASAVFLFLLAIYLATFSGAFTSIDELTLFATTDHLTQAGQLSPEIARFRDFHNPISNFYEPAFPMLAVPLDWLARRWSQVSNMHAAMLLNPLLTAATASLLYLLGRQLGYAQKASLVLAVAFGLGTMAWPYTKTFLREPAVGLLWVLSFMGLARMRDRFSWSALLWAAVPAILSAAVKVASVVIWPVVFGVAAEVLWRTRRIQRGALLLAGALLASAAVALVLIVLPQRGWTAESIIGRLFDFTPGGWLPVYGLLFSPGKSVFIYSPILVMSVIAFPAFLRKHRALAIGLALLWLGELLAVRTSDAWYGGLAWGPRYLLPLVPLSLMPILEAFPLSKWTWLWAAISAAFQALVSSSNWAKGYGDLFARNPNPDVTIGMDWREWAVAPAVQLARQWGRSTWDLVWLHTGLAQELKIDPGLALVLAIVVGVTGIGLWLVWTGRASRLSSAIGVVSVALVMPFLLWRAYWNLADFPGLTAQTMRTLAVDLSTDPRQPDRIIYVSNDIGTHPWLGLLKGATQPIWISPAQMDKYEALLPPEPDARLSVVVDRPHIGSLYPQDTLVDWLATRAYRYDSRWAEGYQTFHFTLLSNSGLAQALDLTWPAGVAATGVRVPFQVTPGAVLPVEVQLRCLTDDWQRSARLFVHLIGPDGTVIFGEDGLLQYGLLAALNWHSGQEATERRGLWIPPGTAPGQYSLVLGLADSVGYIPVTLSSGQVEDFAVVGTVTLSP